MRRKLSKATHSDIEADIPVELRTASRAFGFQFMTMKDSQ